MLLAGKPHSQAQRELAFWRRGVGLVFILNSGLELVTLLQLDLNSRPSCLYLHSTGVIGVQQDTWLHAQIPQLLASSL